MIEVRAVGATADGTTVEEVTVSGDGVMLRLLSLGAAIRGMDVPDADGRPGPVHLELADVAAYQDRVRNPHLGASIGRYANRIAGARFPLDGREVALVPNQGPNQLHGGPDGFDRHVWDVLDADGDPAGGTVVFRITSPDGDQGFPGRVEATATYELAGSVLTIRYAGTTDAPTVLNMTNHGYWNLDGAPTVDAHHLALAADLVLPVDGDGIPTGALEPVAGTPFDLRERVALGPAMAAHPPGFDHCFAVRGAPATLRPAAVLDAPASGRWMTVRTDQPGIQLYTGNGLGDPFRAHGSVSLETQLFPDTPNRPDLGSAVLRPGEEYGAVTELAFGVGAPPRLDQLVAGASAGG